MRCSALLISTLVAFVAAAPVAKELEDDYSTTPSKSNYQLPSERSSRSGLGSVGQGQTREDDSYLNDNYNGNYDDSEDYNTSGAQLQNGEGLDDEDASYLEDEEQGGLNQGARDDYLSGNDRLSSREGSQLPSQQRGSTGGSSDLSSGYNPDSA